MCTVIRERDVSRHSHSMVQARCSSVTSLTLSAYGPEPAYMTVMEEVTGKDDFKMIFNHAQKSHGDQPHLVWRST